MPMFNYKVKDRAGNTRTGTLEAESEHAAAAMIREAGGFPMEIRPIAGAAPVVHPEAAAGSAFLHYVLHPLWTGVNIRALLLFYRQLETLLAAGMSMSEALRSMGERARGPLRRIILRACGHVQAGGQLSDELSRHPRVFQPMQVSLIRIGEAGGLMEEMVSRIASYLEYEIAIRQRIVKIILYPLAIFAFIVVIPHAPVLFLGGPMPFALSLWSSVRVWLPWVVTGIVALKLIMQIEISRLVWDTMKILPPVFGPMAKKIAMTRFCRAVSVLYSAGMPIGTALSASADACGNTYIGRCIKKAVPFIQSGAGITESLSRTGVMMPMVLDMLSTGEKTGSLQPVLDKAADYMDEEVDATIYKAGIALFVLLILVAGWVVLRMVVQFYTGQFTNIMQRANE